MPDPLHPDEPRGPDGASQPPGERAVEQGPPDAEPVSLAAAPMPGAAGPPGDGSDVPLRQLDPRWIAAERISGGIGAMVLLTGALIVVLIFGAGWRLLALGAWAVLSVVLVAAAMAAPAIQYRRARYRVTPFGLEIRWGVLWRRVTIVPRSRIQHTDVEQGPLLRRFGLAKLVVHTAGTEHSTVPLYGLAMPEATAIRDDLMGRASGAASTGAGDGI